MGTWDWYLALTVDGITMWMAYGPRIDTRWHN